MACHYKHSIIYDALFHLMQDRRTALSRVCEDGYVEIVKALLDKGAVIDLTDEVSLLCVQVLHESTPKSHFKGIVYYTLLFVRCVLMVLYV